MGNFSDAQSEEKKISQKNSSLKILIVDDDFTNRLLLQKLLEPYGEVHIAVNGKEAVRAVEKSLKDKESYDLACLDIMMPEMDGQEALKQIRERENSAGIQPGNGIKILMTTALDDSRNIMDSFKSQCEGYIVKPISKNKLLGLLEKLALI